MTPERIIIHHSLTRDSGSVSWAAIRRYHTRTLGWSDIGYHAGAELVGNEVECFYGRPDTRNGAHTQGHNYDTLGFCFVGNFDIVAPSNDLLMTAVRRVLVPWLATYGMEPEDIHAHREYANKSCPGEMFDMDWLRNMVAGEILEA